MIIITSRLFDLAYSPLILEEDRRNSQVRDLERRVSRTATLDAGVVLDDAGFSDGDRTVNVVVIAPTQEQVDAAQGLVETDGLQRLATIDGLFEGGIETLTLRGSELSLRFLVREKLSA